MVTEKEFLSRCRARHGMKYGYGPFSGLSRPLEITCPVHGKVTLAEAKAHLRGTGCPFCDKEKRRNGRYAKNKGRAYEYRIRDELRALGYDAVTSAGESKSMDNKKIDLISKDLPFYAQIKCTRATPSWHSLEKACPLKDRPFVVFHNRQVDKGSRMGSDGEVVVVPKAFFYELLKKYKE